MHKRSGQPPRDPTEFRYGNAFEQGIDKLGVAGSSPVPPMKKALHSGALVLAGQAARCYQGATSSCASMISSAVVRPACGVSRCYQRPSRVFARSRGKTLICLNHADRTWAEEARDGPNSSGRSRTNRASDSATRARQWSASHAEADASFGTIRGTEPWFRGGAVPPVP
jgi:hypothetical protein